MSNKFNKQIKIRMGKKMKAPSWTNEEKLLLLENVKTFDDIVNKKFLSSLTKEQKEKKIAIVIVKIVITVQIFSY